MIYDDDIYARHNNSTQLALRSWKCVKLHLAYNSFSLLHSIYPKHALCKWKEKGWQLRCPQSHIILSTLYNYNTLLYDFSLGPASQKQSTTSYRLQVRSGSACSERQNRMAIYIVTGDARSPMAKQDLLYTCVLVYICVVVLSDYACMSACACVSWQRNNYLNVVSREIPNRPCTVFSVIPRLVYLLQQQNCLTSLLGEGGEEEERGEGKEVRLICIATI